MDWPNLFVGFLLGFCANLISAWIYVGFAKAGVRRKLQVIAGDYTAYPLKGGEEKPDDILYDNPNGKCRITYDKGNILRLRYEEIAQDNIWEAVIWMETPNFGSLAWRYLRLYGNQPPTEHRYGFKRCIFSEGRGRKGEPRWYFYLEGDPPYGKEALEKN